MYGSDPARTNPQSLLDKPTSLPKALVAAVGVGLAFGAGFVVGGIGDARADVAVDAVDVDPVAAAAARTKAYEERMKGVQLSWHKELATVDTLPSTVPQAPLVSSKAVAPAPEEPSSAPIVDKAVVQAPEEPAPAPKKHAAKEEQDDADRDDDGDKKVKSKPNLDAAIGKVLGEASAPKPSTSTTPEKRYALQLGSTGTEAAAKVLADGWAARGHKVSIVAAEVAGKGTMYRVRIGGIASRAAADALKAKLGQGLVVND